MSEKKKKKKCKIVVKEKAPKIEQKEIVEEKQPEEESDLEETIEDIREAAEFLDINLDKIIEHINRNKGKKPIEPPPYCD